MKVPQFIKRQVQRIISPEVYQIITTEVRLFLTPKAKSFDLCRALLRQKEGFEIGGPSQIFSRSGLLPVYKVARNIDNCNFSDNTIWEGAIIEGKNYFFDKEKEPGYQYVREAVDLHGIESGSMDFVLSSHNIEHVANPIKALKEWLRILNDGGLLVLVVPHKDGTFDRQRPVTKIEHLVDDFYKGTGEGDLTHAEEIIRLHDFSMGAGIDDRRNLVKSTQNNLATRCLHHHVFDVRLVAQLLHYLGLEVCSIEALLPMHIIAIGKKLPYDNTPDNSEFLSKSAKYLESSPFPSDRL